MKITGHRHLMGIVRHHPIVTSAMHGAEEHLAAITLQRRLMATTVTIPVGLMAAAVIKAVPTGLQNPS